MEPTSSNRRASPLVWAGFHPRFTWELSGGLALARGPDMLTSVKIPLRYGSKQVMNNALGPKCLALLIGLALFVVFIWKISSPPRRDLGQSMTRYRLRGLAL